MLDLYITIYDKTPEVMILDYNVLRTKSHLLRNREFDHSLIIFVDCNFIFENTAQLRQGFSLNIEYELNILYKTHKS